MNFFGTLIAVLLALYLTGNVQEGSILYNFGVGGVVRDAFVVAGFAIAGVFGFVIVLLVRSHGLTPRALWNDFKSGKLKF